MATQLDFPFPKPHGRPGQTSLWIVACPDGDAARAADYLSRFRHLFVDARTGAPTIAPQDHILLRTQASGRFELFGPALPANGAIDLDLGQVLRSAGEVGGPVQPDEKARPVVGLFFGRSGLATQAPPSDATSLETILATLRHATFRTSHQARLDRSARARENLSALAAPGLLATFTREAADAARQLCVSALDGPGITRMQELYQQADGYFRSSGLRGQVDRVRVLSDTSGHDQLSLPFAEGEAPPSLAPTRLAYRHLRLIAHRFDTPALIGARPSAQTTTARARTRIADLQLSDMVLCRWLAGLGSARLRAWHDWSPGEGANRWTLRAGLDTDLSVLLGIAGRTGEKDGRYSLKAWGRGCVVEPRRLDCAIGEPARLSITTDGRGACGVDLELTNSAGARLPLRLKTPDADLGHQPQALHR